MTESIETENCAVQGNQKDQLCHYPKRANELTENMRRRVNGHQLAWNGQVLGKTSLPKLKSFVDYLVLMSLV